MFNHPFGHFALNLYGRPQVSSLCLQLQDECAVDINLVLWAAWLNACGLVLPSGHWGQVCDRVRHWRWLLKPLRWLRRRGRGTGLYPLLKRVELWAEAREMQVLYRLAASLPLEVGLRDNVEIYLQLTGAGDWLPQWRAMQEM